MQLVIHGASLKKELQKKKISMLSLANFLGVNEKTIQRWCQSELSNIKQDKIDLILEFLNIPLKEIQLSNTYNLDKLELLLSDDYFKKIRLEGSFKIYEIKLEKYDYRLIQPGLQELYLCRLGFCKSLLHKHKSAIYFFELAMKSPRFTEQERLNSHAAILLNSYQSRGQQKKFISCLNSLQMPAYIKKFMLARSNLNSGNVREAISQLTESLNIASSLQIPDKVNLCSIYSQLIIAQIKDGDFSKAREYALSSSKLADELKSKAEQICSLLFLIIIAIKQNEADVLLQVENKLHHLDNQILNSITQYGLARFVIFVNILKGNLSLAEDQIKFIIKKHHRERNVFSYFSLLLLMVRKLNSKYRGTSDRGLDKAIQIYFNSKNYYRINQIDLLLKCNSPAQIDPLNFL